MHLLRKALTLNAVCHYKTTLIYSNGPSREICKNEWRICLLACLSKRSDVYLVTVKCHVVELITLSKSQNALNNISCYANVTMLFKYHNTVIYAILCIYVLYPHGLYSLLEF